VFVTVGQGDVPTELKAGASGGSDVGSSSTFKFGRIIGILLFLGLIYWLLIGRHKKQ
jgi:hypothetical protein